MKRLALLILVFTSIMIISFTLKEKNESDQFIVVELFTSQGCSSCPAADRLLSEVADKDDIIALSFHVSYWNYLGWKDPYSSEQFTNRQRAYAQQFNLRSIYTPQMIVNGSKEFVGSDKTKLYNSIGANQGETIDISINSIKQEKGKLEFDYQIKGGIEDLTLNIAIVERHVKNYVPRGENGGRTLAHDNVVRYFDSLKARGKELISIDLPQFTSEEKLIILYIQDKDFTVKGATKLTF